AQFGMNGADGIDAVRIVGLAQLAQDADAVLVQVLQALGVVVLALGLFGQGKIRGGIQQRGGLGLQRLDELIQQGRLSLHALQQIVCREAHLSRSRTLASRPSAMRLGSIFNSPEASASRICWTRSAWMSSPLPFRAARWRAAGLRSTAVRPLAAEPEAAWEAVSLRVPPVTPFSRGLDE